MASTFTPNLAVEKPGSGDFVGTWDAPVNSNMGVYDSALGTTQSINLAAGSITLSTAQTRSAVLNFVGTLPGHVVVTIPTLSSAPGTTVSGRVFSMANYTNNSSQFSVQILSTTGTGIQVCLPPGTLTDIVMEGSGSSTAGAIRFRNLPPVGSFMDIAGTAIPTWIINTVPPPWLSCDGSVISSATFPQLTALIGTTLPDARGRYRATLNQGTGRITAGSGVNGDTLFSAGGSQTIAQGNLPNVTLNTTIAAGQGSHAHTANAALTPETASGGGTNHLLTGSSLSGIVNANTLPAMSGTTPLGGSGTAYAQPSYMGGLTFIRAG